LGGLADLEMDDVVHLRGQRHDAADLRAGQRLDFPWQYGRVGHPASPGFGWRQAASATTGFLRTPTRSTSTSQTSPGFMKSCGSMAMPTPEGVPVTMMSPGSRVMPVLSSETSFSTVKIRSEVVAFCTTSLLSRVSITSPRAPAGNS